MNIRIGRRVFSIVILFIVAAIIPAFAAVVYVGAVRLSNVDRFDPAYFTPELKAEYDTPAHVAGALAKALEANDQAVLAQLQGTRRPVTFAPGGEMTVPLIQPMERSTYLKAWIADSQTDTYAIYWLGPVQGRWIVSPQDDYSAVDSGTWVATWGPLALGWWIFEGAVGVAFWLRATSMRWQRDRLRKHTPG